MKKLFLYTILCLGFMTACEIDEQVDPNAPSLNSVLTDASITELNLLTTGVESSMRFGLGTYVNASGSIARELYIFDADPRNTEDLLGKEGTALDNNTFYLTAPYNGRYRAIKNANILLDALDNTNSVSEQEKNGYRGFANTMKSLMYLQVLNMLDDNGIRVDVRDPENLGPFVSKDGGFDAILNLLDEARGQLSGSSIIFNLSSGFDGFSTADQLIKVNYAIAARAATNAGRYELAKSLLANSFINKGGDLAVGPKHSYSLGSGDLVNPIFKQPDQNGDQLVVHNDVIADILPGDTRVSKFKMRINPTSQDGLNGTHEIALYASPASSMDIVRNEELILISAEVNIQTNSLSEAVSDLNIIRNAFGLGDYTGGQTKDDLIEELLYQRRYSLWAEGFRMFDLRRYGRLNANFLSIDRPGDLVHEMFPIPQTENE